MGVSTTDDFSPFNRLAEDVCCRIDWGALRREGLAMTIKLHIGNLGQSTRESDLENLFNRVGLVMSVSIPTDAKTGNRKNFGFVNMGTPDGADAAIKTLNGSVLCERQISVREAQAKD